MIPAGWLDHLLKTARWVQKGLPESRLVDRMRKLTLLDNAMGRFGGAAAEERGGEIGRRQCLVGTCHRGGKRRRLFGVGEGPAEAAAEAKQESMEVVGNSSSKSSSVSSGY